MTEVERVALTQALYLRDRVCYAYSVGFEPFEWQKRFLRDPAPWKLLLCGRQSGKSTVISLATCHKAKYRPGSLSVVIAPDKNQSGLDMDKIRSFLRRDPTYPDVVKDNDDELRLDNGSSIRVVTATDRGARGYSAPDVVIFDEAAQIPDDVLGAALPMVTHSAPGYEVVYLSTPHGQSGGFYHAAAGADGGDAMQWHRYMVVSPWSPEDDGMHLRRDELPTRSGRDASRAAGWADGTVRRTRTRRCRRRSCARSARRSTGRSTAASSSPRTTTCSTRRTSTA